MAAVHRALKVPASVSDKITSRTVSRPQSTLPPAVSCDRRCGCYAPVCTVCLCIAALGSLSRQDCRRLHAAPRPTSRGRRAAVRGGRPVKQVVRRSSYDCQYAPLPGAELLACSARKADERSSSLLLTAAAAAAAQFVRRRLDKPPLACISTAPSAGCAAPVAATASASCAAAAATQHL
jgi:hypothetical protein